MVIDVLAEEGTLFRNFFANHQASEGGLISLLGGYPPMHFPNASPYMFDEFAIQPSVLAEYRQQGYYTGFLTNSDLGFIGMDHYLHGLGFSDLIPPPLCPLYLRHKPVWYRRVLLLRRCW